jgi:hypothetical protein
MIPKRRGEKKSCFTFRLGKKMKTAQNVTFDKLKQNKNLSGGFAWF